MVQIRSKPNFCFKSHVKILPRLKESSDAARVVVLQYCSQKKHSIGATTSGSSLIWKDFRLNRWKREREEASGELLLFISAVCLRDFWSYHTKSTYHSDFWWCNNKVARFASDNKLIYPTNLILPV